MRTSTLAPARANLNVGLAQADHDFLSGLAGELASYLADSTEQDNAQALAQATADLAATVDRAQTLLGTTDDLGNPIPIDWSTISTLPGGATGLPVNFTPADPNVQPPADTLTGGSAAEPIVPFLLPLLLPLAPQSRLVPDTPDPDRRELPDDHREAANGISRPRGQLAPTHGQTGNWSDLYKFAHNTPAASDNPPPQPKQTVTNVPRQEQENGTRLRINPDETLAGGDGRTMADIMRQRMVTPPKPQASYLQRLQDSYVNAVRRIAELVKLMDQDRDKEGQPVADNVQDHRKQELERWEAEAERLRVLLVRAGYQFENQSRAFSSEFELTGVNDLIKNDQTDRAAVQKPFSQGLIKAGNEFLEYSKDYATERATDQVLGSVGGIAAAKLLSAVVGKAHDFYKAYKAQKVLRQPKSVGAMARRGPHKIEPQTDVSKGLPNFTDELTVDAQAARRHLRRNVPGTGGQAHHIIPFERHSHEIVQRAARGGFNINGANNGIRLDLTQHLGSHPKYNAAVTKKLDDLFRMNPGISDVDAAKALQQYVDQLRAGLERSTSKLR